MAEFRIPVADADNEKSTIGIEVADAVGDAALTSLFGAIQGVLLGNEGQSVLRTDVNKDNGPGGVPANNFAQRGIKWLIRYTDDVTGKQESRELPTADLALLATGTEFMDIGAGAGLTLVTELESTMLSSEGNAISVVNIEYVNR